MEKTQSLQDMLAQRAEKRLNDDVRKLSDAVRSNPLLRKAATPNLSYEIQPATETQTAKMKTATIYDMLYEHSAYLNDLKKGLLPTYIQEETENFIKKVDALDAQIQEIKEGLEEY